MSLSMKPKIMKNLFCFFAALAVTVSAAAATSSIHLRGVLNLGDEQQFSVATDGGAKTAWVAVGDTFDGYEVAAFDAEENTLVLRKDGEEIRLGLAAGNSQTAKDDSASTYEEAEELLRSMKFEEMLATTTERQKEAMERMIRQMSQQLGGEADEEMIAQQMKIMDAFNKEMDWAGVRKDMVKVYGETLTKEELRGLINFYSTPAGQGFIDKQGELAQRTMEVMQPRMMAVMGKMQAMMQEAEELENTEELPTPSEQLPATSEP